MAHHLVALLLADLDAGRSEPADFSKLYVSANVSLWPGFYSKRRTGLLQTFVQTHLDAHLADRLDSRQLGEKFTLLLEMAGRRDGSLTHFLLEKSFD